MIPSANMSVSHLPQKSKTSKAELLAPVAVGLAALLLYALTVSRDVGLGDSAELSLQAWKLGVTHPPGYPVHTLLGKLFTLIFAEPAMGTNVLSAVSTALAAGLLTRIALNLAVSVPAAAIAGILFAVLPPVWDHAIITEAYALNTCVLAWALLLALKRSSRSKSEPRASARADSTPMAPQQVEDDTKATGVADLCVSPAKPSPTVFALAAVLGISLGSSLANVLLLPGFVLLVASRWRPRIRDYCLAGVLFAVVSVAVVSWNLLRAAGAPPLGTAVVPDSVTNLAHFLSGSQYAALKAPSLPFVLHRVAEHAIAWANAFLWIGIVYAAAGLYASWRCGRGVCVALLAMFLANWGYFTAYPWVDYQSMVSTSYLIFCIWIALGVDQLSTRLAPRTGAVVVIVMPVIIASLLAAIGFREHFGQRKLQPAAMFARASLERFPPDALVVANWNIHTTLCYFQQVHGLRPDVTLVERAHQIRHYPWGMVRDWQLLAKEAASRRPVFIDALDRTTGVETEAKSPSTIGSAWLRLLPDSERNSRDTEERD